MKVVGLITEYNPFHNGHEYHIQKAREITGADYVIAVMSGNYVQRGEPAILDKYTRTKMALLCKADLVLELPVCFATGSAEYFAYGAVSLLDSLGVVNSICFGSEHGEIEPFLQLGKILAEEPESYKEILKSALKTGCSFPLARKEALLTYIKQAGLRSAIPDPEVFLASPNNILGLEYCKAMIKRNSPLIPVTISREGNAYHEEALEGSFLSAAAIRKVLKSNDSVNALNLKMPLRVYELLLNSLGIHGPITENDFSLLLKYKLMEENCESLTRFFDVSPELARRIYNNLKDFKDFSSFIELLKTKELTYSRISRALLHILLNIETKDVLPSALFGRILGFLKSSSPLIREIKERGKIPLLTKIADAKHILSPDALAAFEKDVWCSNLYETVAADKFNRHFTHEMEQNIQILNS